MRRAASWVLPAIFGLLLVLWVGLPIRLALAEEPGTGFPIADQLLRDYYQKRGGVRTFGYPISREFTLQGFPVQMFQRGLLQRLPDGGVAAMNLLDEGLMPYTSFNFSVVPATSRELKESAPSVADPDYARKAIDFVRANAPDEWQGLPVNFFRTFSSTVRYEDAFPQGEADPALVPLLNLELWGLPTSRPEYDPNNRGFVYQRFQRGIMHYDATTGATQGLLLGDYLKAIMTGRDLPRDLEAQARGNPFYRQYEIGADRGPLRSAELPATDLALAFRLGTPDPRFGVVIAGPNTEDPSFLAATLEALGAGSWFSFAGNRANVTGRVELVRPGADLKDLTTRARARPGGAWLIGNEPNVPGQDDLQPGAYADFLAQVSDAIRSADPTAVLVGPNVLNWEKTCTGCPGFGQGRSWSEAFLAAYQERYGKVPLDAWGIHTYSLDWDNLPLTDAAADHAQLISTRTWLDARGLRLPLWLTEFGVIWGFEGIEWVDQGGRRTARPVGQFRADLVGNYLDSMLAWLTGSGGQARVERWFLYATAPPPEPYATEMAGIALMEPGRLILTPFGERYRAWSVRGER